MYNVDLPGRADLPTTRQLIRSTIIAAFTAALLLVTVVLPAEYAVDPTGIGRMLGLTQMGEIKQQLAEEARADAAISVEAAMLEPAPPVDEVAAPPAEEPGAAAAMPAESGPAWRDEIVLTLAPGEAAEIKLTMRSGEATRYNWRADQGHLNSDLHGDGTAGQSTSYRRGRTEEADSGEFTAAFEGSHGWFWRNRSDLSVTLTLQTDGGYSEMKRVL